MLNPQNARHVDLAVETLKRVAANDPEAASYIERKLAESGFALSNDLAASARSLRGIAVGDLDPARGLYLGMVEAAPGHVVHAYAAEDFLRDVKGRQLILSFDEAVKELNKRNGRSYCNGTDRAVEQAIIDGTYQDGDLVLPSKELPRARRKGQHYAP